MNPRQSTRRSECQKPVPSITGQNRPAVDRTPWLRYRPGVSDEPTSEESPSMTVFRPTLKCPKCGLVNATGARRCRRCQRQLDVLDRGAASEELVNAMRSRRNLTLAVIGLVVASVLGMGLAFKWRLDAIGRFRDESRVVDADVKSLLRGARADASILIGAFDDKEFAAILREQGPYWRERTNACDAIRRRVRELGPLDSDQVRETLEIEERLDLACVGSAQLARAADSSDLAVARAAVTRLAGDGASVTPREP